MDVHMEIVGSVTVCRLAGRLDMGGTDLFRSTLGKLAEEGSGPVVLNLEEIAFIGSACLGALVSFHQKLGSDRALALCGLSVPIHKMFKVAAFDRIFQIVPTQTDAVALVGGG